MSDQLQQAAEEFRARFFERTGEGLSGTSVREALRAAAPHLTCSRDKRIEELEGELEAVRAQVAERLLAEAEKLERPNELGEDFTAASIRKVKAQGIRDAVAAAFPVEEGTHAD